MKYELAIGMLAVSFLLFSSSATAQEDASFRENALSWRVQVGGATAFISAPDGVPHDDAKVRLAGGVDFLFNHYFSQTVALNVGLGMIGKGYRASGNVEGMDYTGWVNYEVLQIPFGVLFNLSGFRVGIDLVTSFVVAGRTKVEVSGSIIDGHIKNWEGFRRVNICPRFSLAYAIPLGVVKIAPGVFWEMDILNVNTTENTEGDFSYRHINIMGTIAVEYGF